MPTLVIYESYNILYRISKEYADLVNKPFLILDLFLERDHKMIDIACIISSFRKETENAVIGQAVTEHSWSKGIYQMLPAR